MASGVFQQSRLAVNETTEMSLDSDNQTHNQSDFFPFMTENSASKWAALTLSCIFTAVGPFALYSIIWFEKFGSDKKRTLMNMLFSMVMWTWIVFILVVQVIEIARYIVGPMPGMICILHLVTRYTLVSMVVLILDAMMITR